MNSHLCKREHWTVEFKGPRKGGGLEGGGNERVVASSKRSQPAWCFAPLEIFTFAEKGGKVRRALPPSDKAERAMTQ